MLLCSNWVSESIYLVNFLSTKLGEKKGKELIVGIPLKKNGEYYSK